MPFGPLAAMFIASQTHRRCTGVDFLLHENINTQTAFERPGAVFPVHPVKFSCYQSDTFHCIGKILPSTLGPMMKFKLVNDRKLIQTKSVP